MVIVFSYAQEEEFYTKMLSVLHTMFAYLVMIGKLLEEGIKIRKFVKTPTSPGTSGF